MEELAEAIQRAIVAFDIFRLAMDPAYETERAVAFFEGRVPPSREVFNGDKA